MRLNSGVGRHMNQSRNLNWLGIALSILLVAADVLLLVDPGLAPEFRPKGGLHGPLFFGNTSPNAVRTYAAALLIVGIGVGFSPLHKSRD